LIQKIELDGRDLELWCLYAKNGGIESSGPMEGDKMYMYLDTLPALRHAQVLYAKFDPTNDIMGMFASEGDISKTLRLAFGKQDLAVSIVRR
jgi:hypothetical protein